MSLQDQTGKKVPQVTFKVREGHKWVEKPPTIILKEKKLFFLDYLVRTHQPVRRPTYHATMNFIKNFVRREWTILFVFR